MKSRKEKRKEFRKAKKVKKHEFFSKKKQKTNKEGNKNFSKSDSFPKGKSPIEKKRQERNPLEKVESKPSMKDNVKKEFKNPHEKWDYEREKEKKERETLNREIRKQRIKQLKMDNMKEDMEIRKLEKQLKMNKGKSKAFTLDGLDYLLDICDKDASKNEFMKTLDDTDSEFESDVDNILGTSNKKEVKSKKEKKIKDKKVNKINHESEEEELESELEQGSEVEESEEIDNEIDESEISELENEEEFDDYDSENSDESVEESKRMKNKTKDIKNKRKRKTSTAEKNKKMKFEDETSEASEEEEIDEDENFIEEAEEEEEEEDDDKEEDEVDKKKSPEVSKMWEDIYGRTRDEKGNVVKTYTPPQLRKKLGGGDESAGKNNEKLERLKKQLKGLLNRLSESNMAFISNQIEQLYMSNSRNDMNETLSKLFTESLMTEVLTPERLITEHAMLVAVLHTNIGSEIGAHFLQYAVTEFCKILESNPLVEDKTINNILVFIIHLYNFQIFHSKLMYDILNELLKNLEEKQIELLLTTLRTVGFSLRKDDPLALKSFILKVQEQANGLSSGENSSRVKFMLEMLMAIKNNNVSKIPNYNPELVERMRKNLKVLVRKGNFSTVLNISLQDLLNAEERGRWWIVGSAWSGSAPTQPDSNTAGETENSTTGTEFSEKLLELARKQRMNTDVRRNVFCILMSAEDFLEAFEKLLKLKLKGTVEREIMNVLIHCALQEKNFNPYYVYVANKFCTFDRKYQMMLQCALWDRIKEIKNLLPVQVTNLAKFVGRVILERGLPISVLKVIQFSDLDKPTIKFMRQVLLTILAAEDRNSSVAVFKRIAESSKLKMFRESLRLFLQHFVLKNVKNVGDEGKVSRLVEMVKVAEQALTSSDVSKMIF